MSTPMLFLRYVLFVLLLQPLSPVESFVTELQIHNVNFLCGTRRRLRRNRREQQQQPQQQQPQQIFRSILSNRMATPMKGPVSQPLRPNTCTYWVSEHVLAGERPTAKQGGLDATRIKLGHYLDAGISVFIDLTESGQKPDYEIVLRELAETRGIANDVEYHRIPIPDFGIPTTTTDMVTILNAMDDAVSRNKKVYVHCAGGIGRTGTTIGCYLVRHGNDGKTALQEVNRLFQHSDRSMESWSSPETREQISFVRDWKESHSS
jgi:protein-tyrosine phosphatase